VFLKTNLQSDYVEKVVAISVSPLNCSNQFYNKKVSKYTPGKRYSLNKFALKDYLTVGSNQLVFELDYKGYKSNYNTAKKIIEALENLQYPYEIFSSGGKGLHIELWFNALKIKNDNDKEMFKKAASNGLSFKHIRLWLFDTILELASIPKEIRGAGKLIDTSCILFDDLNFKTKLLRLCGGRKTFIDKNTKDEVTYYKTRILKDEFNSKQIKETNFENVRYPPNLEGFDIDYNGFLGFLNDFNNRSALSHVKSLNPIILKSGYTKLDSVQRILEGMPKGKRSMGAQVLAIAMGNDGLSEDKQRVLVQEYVDNCSQLEDEFTFEEAYQWVEWVSSQQNIFWNCELTKNLEVHNDELCAYCKKQHKADYEFLEQTTILKQIEEILDQEIKGEFETKMLVFLLMLSKDFPSSSGKPEWNILNDPMSQNIILSSASSSGKSYMTKKLLKLFGEEGKDYFIVSRISKSALNYYTEINMDGKVVFIEELQGLDENTNQLRVWMSEGQLRLDTVEKVKDSDGIEVNVKVTKVTCGQPVFITNQAEGEIGEQLLNRSWVISMDTSDKQTEQILKFQDELNMGLIPEFDIRLRRLKDSLKLLKPYHFLIPFSNMKVLNIPLNEPRSRRDYDKFNTVIRCSGHLHQRQRMIVEKNGKEFIVCSLLDYDVARRYADNILGATFSGLQNDQISMLNNIRGKNEWVIVGFTISDLMRTYNMTQPYWYGQLKHLVNLGYLTNDRGGGNQSDTYHLVIEKIINIINLPSSSELEDLFKIGLLKLQENGFCYKSGNNLFKNKNDEKSSLVIANEDVEHKKVEICYNEKKCVEMETFSRPISKNIWSRSQSVIANTTTRNYILEYVRKSEKHIIPIEEIIQKIGEEKRDEIDNVIQGLKNTGEIMEIKPGKVMLL